MYGMLMGAFRLEALYASTLMSAPNMAFAAQMLNKWWISQKKIWQSIADELVKNTYSVTGPQCQSKFGGLKRTYNSIKDHNGKSGNGPRTWPYFEIMDGLLGVKPYIIPIATVSSTGKRDQPEVDNSLASDISPHRELPKKKSNYSSSVDKVLLAIEENRKVSEENKENRHKEKMEQKREAINLLARLVNVLGQLKLF
ncbi:uncharacterized protein LOC103308159 [Acyrthosiphon pisum]|uniref:Myb/SANT-like DNA-binding domain-containing protein n=1 Tax=Acyrthosiphon pisum TaxID=7029 RepID=A0A8R1WYB2_ACYPI|nr:uncharacterized protein LOC103308159 [Acyrthosiphon pisum]|eukprot:XP_008179324.1 PREDICTED: uncharacterized protein LOC103308159 [Acyrthosiphon pisum]